MIQSIEGWAFQGVMGRLEGFELSWEFLRTEQGQAVLGKPAGEWEHVRGYVLGSFEIRSRFWFGVAHLIVRGVDQEQVLQVPLQI